MQQPDQDRRRDRRTLLQIVVPLAVLLLVAAVSGWVSPPLWVTVLFVAVLSLAVTIGYVIRIRAATGTWTPAPQNYYAVGAGFLFGVIFLFLAVALWASGGN